MFETLKVSYKVLKGSFKMAKQGGVQDYTSNQVKAGKYNEKIDFNGYNVYTMNNDDIVLGCGFRFGACVVIPGFDIFEQGQCVIVYEKKALELGVDEFIKYHEMGHIVNEILTGKFSIERSLVNEFEADLYAANQIGFSKAIESLRIMANQKACDADEIELRIGFLKLQQER